MAPLIATRLHRASSWFALVRDWLVSEWLVSSRYEVGNNLVIGWHHGGVIFDASLHADVIRLSHSRGSAMPPALPDIIYST